MDEFFKKINFNNAKEPLFIPTYDGSNQPTHPDILYYPQTWNGYHYWMVMTPYPYSNAFLENPSILVSNNGLEWFEPKDISNPIKNNNFKKKSGHLSDPCLVKGFNGKLYMIYRSAQYLDKNKFIKNKFIKKMFYKAKSFLGKVNNKRRQKVIISSSKDGLNWSEDKVIEDKITNNNIKAWSLSPSVVFKDGVYYMYTIKSFYDKKNIIQIRKTNNLLEEWTEPKDVSIPNLDSFHEHWHINVKKFYDYFIAVIVEWDIKSGHHKLQFSYSENGKEWFNKNKYLLKPSSNNQQWDSHHLYQSCLLPVENNNKSEFILYYSGVKNNIWNIGMTKVEI